MFYIIGTLEVFTLCEAQDSQHFYKLLQELTRGVFNYLLTKLNATNVLGTKICFTRKLTCIETIKQLFYSKTARRYRLLRFRRKLYFIRVDLLIEQPTCLCWRKYISFVSLQFGLTTMTLLS